MHTYNPYPVLFVKGEGSYLYDNENKKYLDLFSGIAVNNLGYQNKAVIEAIVDQTNKLMHVSNLYYTEPMLETAKLLVSASGLKDGKVFFCNSGTEANEAALKLARLFGEKKGKTKVVSALNSFHGRTLGGMTLTGQQKYHEGFYPLVPEITYTKFNDIDSLKESLTDDTAALFLECVQGEGGVLVATEEYLKLARTLCDEKDILLIFDEVQTGIGRTGSFFAYETIGVTPDVVTVAKGLGGGLPIGAVIATGEASVFSPGKHASTFGGNPVTTKAASVVIKEINNPLFLSSVKEKGDLFKSLLEEKLNSSEIKHLVKEVRGLGLMIGIQLEVEVSKIVSQALSLGLVVGSAGSNVLRLLPPLTISKEEIVCGVEILVQAINEASSPSKNSLEG